MRNLVFKYTGISISLHLLLLVVASGVLFSFCAKGDKSPHNPQQTGNIVEAPKSVDAELLNTPSKSGFHEKKHKKPKLTKCEKKWYGGIGLMNSYDNNARCVVNKVVAGYPAFKAGIEVGDILEDCCSNCVGTVGEEIEVKVIKANGENRIYDLYRDRICSSTD
jgi:hypothetical protein